MIFIKNLVEVSKKVSSTTRKKEKVSILASFLKPARGRDIALAASYLAGRIPQGRLGIGWANMQEALKSLDQKTRPLGLMEIDETFERVLQESGAGSAGRKLKHLQELFSAAAKEEKDFLIRLIMGEIRQGALQGLILEAIAEASSVPPERVRQGLMFSGDIGEVARVSLEEGTAGLSRFQPRLFHPILPMLANPAEGEEEALARLGEAGWEYKIDGARIQIHKEGEEIRVFTRHLKEVTDSVPELVRLAGGFPAKKAIFDGEAIALREDGKPFPFQTTMRRFGRIQELEKMEKEVPITAYFFDLLYLEGQPLFEEPYRERFDLLAGTVPPQYLIPHLVSADEKGVREFLNRSLQAGHEGLVAKGLNSPYLAGHRGFYWLKLKRAQTLDLAILAAEWGHGRRRGWLSNLHLGARDAESGQWVMLGKTFKGLTDEMLRWQTERLLQLEIARDEWTVYVKPELVVEIAYDGIQESPRYPGGLALRFARVKSYREDKSSPEADTIQKVQASFKSQRK